MKESLYRLGKVAIVLGMFVFLLNMLIDNPYSHRLARSAINSQLTRATGLKLEFESIHLRLVPLSVDMYGIKLVAKDYPDDPLLSMARLYARVSLWSLVLGQPRLAIIEAQELKGVWPPRPEIMALLESHFPKDEGPTRWPPDMTLPVDRLRIKDGFLQWNMDPVAPGEPALLKAALKGLDVDLVYENWRDLRAALQVHELGLSYKDRPMLDGTQVQFDVALRKNHLESRNLRVKGKDLDVSGRVGLDLRLGRPRGDRFTKSFEADLLEAIEVESELEVKGDLAPLGAVINAAATSGPVSGKGKFKGWFPVSADGEARWDMVVDGQAHGARIDDFLLYDSKSRLVFTADQMLFQDAVIQEGDKRYATGDGFIKFNDPLDMRFRIRPERLPLDRLLNALKVPDFKAVNAFLVSDEVILAGKGYPFGLRAEGNLRLDDLVIAQAPASPRYPFPKCTIRLLLQIDDTRVKVPPVDGSCQVPMAKAASGKTPASDKAVVESGAPDKAASSVGVERRDADTGAAGHKADTSVGQHRQDAGVDVERGPQDAKVAGHKVVDAEPKNQAAETERRNLRIGGTFSYETRQGMDFSLELKDFPSENLRAFSRLDHRGPVSGRVAIKGSYDAIRVDVTAAAPRLTVFDMGFKDLTAAVRYEVKDNRVEVSRFLATTVDGGEVAAQQLSLDLDRDWMLRGEARVHELPPAFVSSLVAALAPGTQLSLRVASMEAKIAMPLKRPLAGQGDLSFSLHDASLDGQSLFTDLRGRLSNDGKGWKVPLAEIVHRDLLIRLDLDHSLRPEGRKAVKNAGFNPLREWGIADDDSLRARVELGPAKNGSQRVFPNSFVDLPFVGSYFESIDMTGVTNLTLDLAGEVARLQGRFQGSVEQFYLFKSPVAPVQFSGSYRQGLLDIDRIQQAGHTLTGRLQIDLLAKGLPYEMYVYLRQFDLRALGTEHFFRDPRNFAYINGEWELKGKLTDWWRSQGYLKIHKVLASYVIDAAGRVQTLDIGLVEPVVLDIGPAGWNFRDGKSLHLTGPELDVSFTTKRNAMPDNLGVSWAGSMKINLLRRLFPMVETGKGEVAFEGSLAGQVLDPDISLRVRDRKVTDGGVNWEPLSIGFTGYNPAFTNVTFDMMVEDGLIKIQSFKANKGTSGTVSINGVFNPGDPLLEDTRIAIDVSQAELNRFAVPVLSYADATLSGNFVLSGRAAPFKLSGNVEVGKAQSYGAFDLRDQILEMIRRKRFSTSVAPAAPLVTFDIQVNANDTVKIRNRSIVASLGSDLIILGDNNAPVVLGQVQINKGTFNYKRSFDIQRGNITFDEPVSPPDPKLDIVGETTVSQYRVQTQISGYSSNPVVTLSVDPPNRPDGTPITKVDIIYLLSSGSLPRVERGDTSGSAAARSEAFNLLIGQFEEPIEKLFDLSGQTVIRQVYLDTYPAEEGGRPVARLNLPINLSNNVNLILQVDDDSNAKLSTEYSINDNVSVTGSFDKKREDKNSSNNTNPLPADTGVDLRFRFSFP